MNKKQVETLNNYLNRLIAYCETYNSWPKPYSKPTTPLEKESNSLIYWIGKSNFHNPERPFKYENIHAQDGRLILEIIENLYQKYGLTNYNFSEEAMNITYEIIKYVSTHQEWPIYTLKPTSPKEEESNKLALWLHETSYHPKTNSFKYIAFVGHRGETLKGLLDHLAEIYYGPYETIENYIKTMYAGVKTYAITYRMMPEKYLKPKNPQEELSNTLYDWLKSSGYLDNAFMYPLIEDSDGNLIKIGLDKLYAIYSPTNRAAIINRLWQAKEKNNVVDTLSGYIINLSCSINDFEMYDYYKTLIENTIKKYNLPLTFNEICMDIILSDNEQMAIYKYKIQKYQDLKNEELVKLYERLYAFSKSMNEIMLKERNVAPKV